jgi:hypothetical protein
MAKKKISKAKPTPKVKSQSQPKSIKRAIPKPKPSTKKAPTKKAVPAKPAPPKKKVVVKKSAPAKPVAKKKAPAPKAVAKKIVSKPQKKSNAKPAPKKSQVPKKPLKPAPKQNKKAIPKSKKPAPTKRGRKKKNKGSAEYQKIKKYVLDRYKKRTNVTNEKEAEQTARQLYNWLKINGKLKDKKPVTHKLLREALNDLFPQEQKMFGRKRVPDIPDKYLEPNPFYNIDQVIEDHKRGLFRRVWIYSPLILGKRGNGYIFLDPEKTYTYEDTFQDWVNFINELVNSGEYATGSPPDVWFMFRKVFWNSRRKRWEASIIPCDSDGNILNTGFIVGEDETSDNTEQKYGVDPDEFNRDKEEAEREEEAEKEQKKTEPQPSAPPAPVQEPKEVTDAKLKTEQEKQKAYKIQTLVKAKQSIMEDIKFNKEIGEPYEDLMKRLKDIRDQIDKLVQ